MKKYRPRIADKILQRKIASKGAVLIEGASGAENKLQPVK